LKGYDAADTYKDGNPVSSVAISRDGNTVVMGNPRDDNGRGAVFVFTRNAVNPDVWEQRSPKIVLSEPILARLGTSVAINAQGTKIIAGAITVDDAFVGGAFIYAFDSKNKTWFQEGKLVGGEDPVLDPVRCVQNSKLCGARPTGFVFQGSAVSMSDDGNTVLVGGPFVKDNSGFVIGSAWVFIQNGRTWEQQNRLMDAQYEVTNSYDLVSQGCAVALSADGNTLP
jgi:hypothetical protein